MLNVDSNGPRGERTCLPGFANNKGVDEPAYPRNLISKLVFYLLKNII